MQAVYDPWKLAEVMKVDYGTTTFKGLVAAKALDAGIKILEEKPIWRTAVKDIARNAFTNEAEVAMRNAMQAAMTQTELDKFYNLKSKNLYCWDPVNNR